MSESIFKMGDVVTLKSGGEQMVIQQTTPNSDGSVNCMCTWHDKEGKPHTVTYDELSLRLATPPKGRQFTAVNLT
ncbi:MAG: DUF2158 domain-containing protein [Saprospiraceae bacterium]|nr:DUF2158 domain-containing protein [Saprospiraceae bacterium]